MKGQPTTNDQNRHDHLDISGDDVARLPCSPLIGINGVHPLSGFRFIVVGSKLLPTIKSFHLIFENLRQAIWGLEV
jgi:hypothetical protein